MYDELIEQLKNRASWIEFAIIATPSKADGNGDAILFRKAADAIDELQKITTHYEEESKGWWLAACDAKEERERLKEQIPKWIPVTERLPEKDQTVLAYCAEDNFCYISRMHQSFEDYDVTHWIPLPQMPESDGE